MKQHISPRWKSISCGVLKSTADLALFAIAYGIGLAKEPPTAKGVWSAVQWAEGVDCDSIVRTVKYLRSKGWIKQKLGITAEGQKRLNTFIPEPRTYPKRWNGTWYLVSFDIPERLRRKRDELRQALVRLGFGKLHSSLWISPYNFFGDVKKYLKNAYIDDFVILATSNHVGTEISNELANRIWKLEELNEDYGQWIKQYKACQEGNMQGRFELMFSYGALVRRDPFLPKPLLPAPWRGSTTHELFQTISSVRFAAARS